MIIAVKWIQGTKMLASSCVDSNSYLAGLKSQIEHLSQLGVLSRHIRYDEWRQNGRIYLLICDLPVSFIRTLVIRDGHRAGDLAVCFADAR
jgi:hypothetical protein